MFYNGIQVWIRLKDLQRKKKKKKEKPLNHKGELYSQLSYFKEIPPFPDTVCFLNLY